MPTVTNTDATLQGKSLITADANQTITGLKTFDRSGSAPFAVAAGSPKVSNLDADLLDGEDASALHNAANLTGTIPQTALAHALDIGVCQGRLTLTSGTAVTTSDVTAAATLYFTPFKGNRIALYDGADWTVFAFTERSIAVPAVATQMYDVFVYNNAGVLTLELTAWTNDTTRATALTLQDGVYVKTGATTRRYLGSFRTVASGQTEDSLTKRFVWNYYNRVERPLRRLESTSSWTYTSATWRQANAAAANQVEVVIGVAEVTVDVRILALAQNAVGITVHVAVGEDTTAGPTTGNIGMASATIGSSPTIAQITAVFRKMPAVGYHYYAWLEKSTVSGTTTWGGSFSSVDYQGGMYGSVTN